MVSSVTLCKTAIVVLRRLPIYFLCTVWVSAPNILIELANPEFAHNRTYLVSHGAADLAGALAIGLAILTLPAHAIATWHTTTRPTLRESMYALFRNGIALTLLTALLALGWHLAVFRNEFSPSSPFHLALALITVSVLLRCSIAFPIALMENKSTTTSLALSWRRMRWHWLSAGAIASMYGITFFVYSLVLAIEFGRMLPYPATRWFGYAAIQVAWTVALTYLYLHVSPEAAIPTPDAPTSPPGDETNLHEQHGNPAPLKALHGVAPSE